MIRTYDADLINGIINDPDVRPFMGGDTKQAIDLAPWVFNGDNVFLVEGDGGFGFIWTAPDTYEVHAFFSRRGMRAAFMGLRARAWMESYGARHLWTRIPDYDAGMLKYMRVMSFSSCGFQTLDAGNGPHRYELFDWRP